MARGRYFGAGTVARLAPSAVLEKAGVIATHTAGEFAITNDNAGPANGYTIHFFSSVGGTGDFTYVGTKPTGGTITSISITDANGFTYAIFDQDLDNASLANMWTTLKAAGGGPLEALRDVIGRELAFAGSFKADQVETYGSISTFSLGAGNDLLNIRDIQTNADGGGGNDTFVILDPIFGTDIDGGTGTNTIISKIVSFSLAAASDHVSHVQNFVFSGPAQFLFLSLNNFDVSNVRVTGNIGPDILFIQADPNADPNDPLNVDGRDMEFRNFSSNDRVSWSFTSGFDPVTAPFNIIGAPNVRNAFTGNGFINEFVGGNKDDSFFGAAGNDRFYGNGKTDLDGDGDLDAAVYDRSISDADFSLSPGKVADNGLEYGVNVKIEPGPSEGVDRTWGVEAFIFNDATEHLPEIISNGGEPFGELFRAEGTTFVTDVNATDMDEGQALKYSFHGGADRGLFSINASTGVVRFKAAPDFENPLDADGDNHYQVIVKVTDGIASALQLLRIGVTDVFD